MRISITTVRAALCSLGLLVLAGCGGGNASTTPVSGSTPTPLVPTTTAAATTTSTAPILTTTLAGADTSAPSAPGTLAVSGSTSDSISFGWQVSTDDKGVVGYEIWRNGVRIQLTPATQTTFNDIGLAPNTSYSYTVRALDAAGNTSAFSVDLIVRTLIASTPADTSAPSTPTGLAAGAVTASTLTFSWTPSTDNQGVVRYELYRDGILVASTAQTSYVLTGLTANTPYSLTIKAFDAAGNASGASATLGMTTGPAPITPTPDITAPTAPTALVVTQSTSSSLNLAWTASTDNFGVVGYSVLRNGVAIGTTSTPGFLFTGLTASTAYNLAVKAFDAAGNTSAASAALTASTASAAPAADTTAPSAPTSLTVSNPTSSSLTLSWTASTDNVGVVRYDVYRGGVLAGAVTATSSTLSGLSASTSYALTVKAVDAAGNVSASSATLNASTTAVAGDTSAPSTPAGLTLVTASQTSLAIRWTASTDNVGVTRYDVYRDGTLVGNSGSSTTVSYTYAGLAAGTSYSLTVKAIDATGNVSAASAALVTGTLAAVDTTPPIVGTSNAEPITPAGATPAFALGNGTVYHVATTGNDSNPGTLTQPFRTIKKYMSIAQAGDTGQVHAGTYKESTGQPGGWFGDTIASIAPIRSGTSNNPSTLMAYPGDAGLVTIDSENTRTGIGANGTNYWQIYGLRFINSFDAAITSNANTKPDLNTPHTDAELTLGWRIENCLIRDVVASSGGNTAGIQMWWSKGWIVRNNRIANIAGYNGRYSGAILAYGTAHSLVENNYVENARFGVYLKDHILKSATPRATYFEFELRNNVFNVGTAGFISTIKGSPNVESGSNYVHHNIMYGFTDDSGNGATNGSPSVPGATFRFDHNVVDQTGISPGTGFGVYGHEDVRSQGNIFLTPSAYDFNATRNSSNQIVGISFLTHSDYNLFSNPVFLMDHVYGPTSIAQFFSLADWQAARTTSALSLKVNNPDAHSQVITAAQTFVNAAARDYRYKAGSPALNLLGAGNHAGPYQTGTEIIGTLPSYSAGL